MKSYGFEPKSQRKTNIKLLDLLVRVQASQLS